MRKKQAHHEAARIKPVPFADRSPVRVQTCRTSDLDTGASATLVPAAPQAEGKILEMGPGEMAQLNLCLLLQRTTIWLPAFMWQLMTIGDSSFWGYLILFWPPWALSSHGIQILRQNTHTNKTIIKKFFNNPRDQRVSTWVWAGLTTPGLTPEHLLLTVVYQAVDQRGLSFPHPALVTQSHRHLVVGTLGMWLLISAVGSLCRKGAYRE